MTIDEIIKHCDDYITSMNKYADTGNIGWWLQFYHTVLNGFRELKALKAQPIEECKDNGSPWYLGHCSYNTDAQPCKDCMRIYTN